MKFAGERVKEILKNFFLPVLFFFTVIFSYWHYQSLIPISYWDEFLWVGRSYFFDLYINGDFKNKIWKEYPSFDQPKLTEYAYGAWLYPTYLKEKGELSHINSFGDFLFEKKLHHVIGGIEPYLKKNSSRLDSEVECSEVGYIQDYIDKYGIEISPTIKIIQQARIINLFFLSGATVFIYLIGNKLLNIKFAFFLAFIYSQNPLLITQGLKAHSEALFLFNFNAALFFMSSYFLEPRKKILLIVFAIFSGLCFSTKLNGIMWVFIFFILNIYLFLSKKKTNDKIIKIIKDSAVVVTITAIVFLLLNPFALAKPLHNIPYMFKWRMKTAISQSSLHPEDSLKNMNVRLRKTWSNFYSPSAQQTFNSIKMLESNNFYHLALVYQKINPWMFALGLLYAVKLSSKNNLMKITLGSFLITTLFLGIYLQLNWHRYYVHLTGFFLLFQSLGFYLITRKIYLKIIKNN